MEIFYRINIDLYRENFTKMTKKCENGCQVW